VTAAPITSDGLPCLDRLELFLQDGEVYETVWVAGRPYRGRVARVPALALVPEFAVPRLAWRRGDAEPAVLQAKAEAARDAAAANDLAALGAALDAIWRLERAKLPPFPGLDRFYAAARVAGSPGGRAGTHGLALVVPHESVLKEARCYASACSSRTCP
jgi:hypothetical protein